MFSEKTESSQSKLVLQHKSKILQKSSIFFTLFIAIFCLLIYFIYQNLQLKNRLTSQGINPIQDLESTIVSSVEFEELIVDSQESRGRTSMYPPAEEGFSKYYIWLPTLTNESDIQVEIVVGKDGMVDCNSTWYSGNLEEKNVQGGYIYYEVKNPVGPMSTKIFCGENSKMESFVQVRGKNYFVRYNSKLPIVVYVPNEFEVNYKIWKTNNSLFEAERQ
jgi:ecotin